MPVDKGEFVSSLGNFVSSRPMQLAMRELRIRGKWRGPLRGVAFGALLDVMGPFGSQNAFEPA